MQTSNSSTVSSGKGYVKQLTKSVKFNDAENKQGDNSSPTGGNANLVGALVLEVAREKKKDNHEKVEFGETLPGGVTDSEKLLTNTEDGGAADSKDRGGEIETNHVEDKGSSVKLQDSSFPDSSSKSKSTKKKKRRGT